SQCDCYTYDQVFTDIKPYIKKADYAIANLETTLPGEKSEYSGYPQFGSPDSLVDALSDTGFDMLLLSNNHSIDKYRHGVIRTKQVVVQKGFDAVGSYTSESEFEKDRIFYKEIGGIKFAFLNYSYGTNGLPVPTGTIVNGFDYRQIREEIAIAHQNADAIIVTYHYGTEYRRDPDPYQRYAVELAFQEGADIVVGGHPHVLQPFEKRQFTDRYGDSKERLVIWSLGNFVSNQLKRYTDGGMIFSFTVEKATGKSESGEKQKGLILSDLSYLPIWVLDRTTGSNEFRVLPCKDYIELRRPKLNEGKPVEKSNLVVDGVPLVASFRKQLPREISDKAKVRMLQFYIDTLELIGRLPNIETDDEL
ncbi:MAG: CapA family protein, partial [Leptonema sp. (in: Bacteria)]|nr:CapA family protein [Leptonema sp. (in: bacteria)]